MKKIQFIGRYRGFFNDLFHFTNSSVVFYFNESSEFEIITKRKQILLKIFNSTLFDVLGLFTTLKNRTNEKNVLSYNKFIQSTSKMRYSVILENPTALVNYSDTKMFSYFGRKRLIKLFNDPNLIKIVCLSKACRNSFPLYYQYPNLEEKLTQVYPLINNNNNLSSDILFKQSQREVLRALYISSSFSLKGGDDIIQAFEKLKKNNVDIKLTVITKIDKLSNDNQKRINRLKNIELVDFTLSREELYKCYENSNLLLNPSRMDSFSLVTLEALKGGCAILSSDIYAIKEMVHENKNGYLQKPRFEYWNNDGTINHYIKKNPKKTYNSKYTDKQMVNFLYENLVKLDLDRQKLYSFQMYSYVLSQNSDFSDKNIISKWKEIYYN